MFTPQPGAGSMPRRPDDDLYPSSTRIPREGSLLFGGGPSAHSPVLKSPAHVPFTTTKPAADALGSFSSFQPSTAAATDLDVAGFAGGIASYSQRPSIIPQSPLFSPGTGLSGLATKSQQQPTRNQTVTKTPVGPPIESIVDRMHVTPSATISQPEASGDIAAAAPAPMLGIGQLRGDFSGEQSGFWVTAFGFHGAAMVPAVLQELRPSGGDFVQHRMGAGTWMHVQLQNRTDQMDTLAKNGRVLHGFMLGVIEGIVPASHTLDLNAPVQPASAVPLKLHHSRGAEYAVLSKSSGISRYDTVGSGLINKLCEYVFGW